MSHVAAIQLNSGPNIQANMLVVGDLLKEISKTNAKIVVLPEPPLAFMTIILDILFSILIYQTVHISLDCFRL